MAHKWSSEKAFTIFFLTMEKMLRWLPHDLNWAFPVRRVTVGSGSGQQRAHKTFFSLWTAHKQSKQSVWFYFRMSITPPRANLILKLNFKIIWIKIQIMCMIYKVTNWQKWHVTYAIKLMLTQLGNFVEHVCGLVSPLSC